MSIISYLVVKQIARFYDFCFFVFPVALITFGELLNFDACIVLLTERFGQLTQGGFMYLDRFKRFIG
ncbi:MAG: hypothetical protein ACRESZ_03880 [Methylococcales bacterium]